MPNRTLIYAAFCAGISLPAAYGHAEGIDDPFSTETLVFSTAQRAGILHPCQAGPASPLTLTDVVDATLCGNPATREVWANARAEAAALGMAQSAYLPTLDGSISASRVHNSGGSLPTSSTRNQREYDVSLSWLIYDFGARAARIEVARQLLAAANAAQDAAVQALFLAAVQSYYQLQAAQEAEKAAAEAERAALESFNAADARYKAGAATPADQLQARTAWSQATLNRIKAAGDRASAEGTLANTMGLRAAVAVQLAAPAAPPALEEFEANVGQLIDGALARRPDLRAARAQLLAAQANADAARAGGRPRLLLGVSSGETRNGGLADARASVAGVTLSIPLFSGFDTTYRTRAAEAQSQVVAAQRDQLELKVALDVWSGYQSLRTATQTVRSTADLVASAEQSAGMALGRYKAGVGNILDVLNAQSALASARQQRVQSLYGWSITRAALAQAMGTLDRGLIDSLDERTTP